jgi:hypothetical protein
MAAHALQIDHYRSQLFGSDFLTEALMTYVKVLAKDAQQVAMGEEYRSGAVGAHQRGFFAVVG